MSEVKSVVADATIGYVHGSVTTGRVLPILAVLAIQPNLRFQPAWLIQGTCLILLIWTILLAERLTVRQSFWRRS